MMELLKASHALDWIQKGGLMMIPLLVALFIGLMIVIERILFFWFKVNPSYVHHMLKALEQKDFQKVEALIQTQKNPFGEIMQAALSHWNQPRVLLEMAMKNTAEKWIPVIEKKVEVLDTIVTAAPLMGLLGTILGMMASFQLLDTTDQNHTVISAGIAEALICTATGLVVALFCLFAYNYLKNKLRHITYSMESLASFCLQIHLQQSEKTTLPSL